MYSVDPEENKKNPDTPSPFMSLHEQLIYKIAALDASVQQGFRRLDERMDRFQSDLHDSQIEMNDKFIKLEASVDGRFLVKRTKIEELEKGIDRRVKELETWKQALTVRWSLVAAAVVVFWTVFGDHFKTMLGIVG